MNHAVTVASHKYAHATWLLCEELDTLISRILRNDSHLTLEEESSLHWIVVDQANGDTVMMRAGRDLCVRFMRAFAARHPQARVELPVEEVQYSWRVAQPLATVTPIRMLEPVDELG